MPLQTPKIVKEPLTWLFVAFFEDGHVIQQAQDDRSLTRTDGTGSCFSDVLAYQSKSKLKAFELHHTDGKQVVTLDMVYGYFVVNGSPIQVHGQYFDPTKYLLQLIYFRETRVEQTKTATLQVNGSITEQPGESRHYVNRYFIGWQTTVNNKNIQHTIAVG